MIGAWIEDGNTYFRVWVPSTERISVLLQRGASWDANQQMQEKPLSPEGNGYWSARVTGIESGTLYRYSMTQQGITQQKLDPAARDVIHSELTRYNPENQNASIVVGPDTTAWVPFNTPEFENFIIYQFHVGSFAGRNDHLGNKPVATFNDIVSKLDYIRELGFNAIALLPVHEFTRDRSWGYNPGSFFAPESAYGSPKDLRQLVNEAHSRGIAVIFDVVYNHAGPDDNVLHRFDIPDLRSSGGGSYFEGGQITDWGRGPAWWRQEVQDFFYDNARLFLDDYRGDGLRFDSTTSINGNHLRKVIWRLRQSYPNKYLIAEHLPAHPWITTTGNFHATWFSRAHHECQRALVGLDPVAKVKSFLGWDGFNYAWNLVKYTLGSHDDCGDLENGDAEHGLMNWDARHRYLIDQIGGRDNWHARAKCRLAWALNVFMPGTPMLFMGSECHMGSPEVAWGYWHDGSDNNGDHRFDWSIAGDPIGASMRRLVAATNQIRWENPALRSNSLSIPHEDYENSIIAFVRSLWDNTILTIVNLSENNFENNSYGVSTDGRFGQWTQILCSQDASFGGWDGAGNAFYQPWTQSDGRIYINLPKWSVVAFRLL